MSFDWKNNVGMNNCQICGQPVHHGNGWVLVGLCELHLKMFEEDMKSGWKQNRLREIMVARGEVSEYNNN